MECRSTERRQWIVNKYDVVPVAHIQLLANLTKHSDAGAMIENDYYIFMRPIRKVEKRDCPMWHRCSKRLWCRKYPRPRRMDI